SLFNPHATIKLDWFGTKDHWRATNQKLEKWKPCRPTSSHWYELQHLERLLGAYITHDRKRQSDRLVSDFLAEFDGLTGSANRTKVLEACDLKRVHLSELVVNGQFDHDRVSSLLLAMQNKTRPVKPKCLGLIGEEHFRTRLVEMGVKPESFRYSKKLS